MWGSGAQTVKCRSGIEKTDKLTNCFAFEFLPPFLNGMSREFDPTPRTGKAGWIAVTLPRVLIQLLEDQHDQFSDEELKRSETVRRPVPGSKTHSHTHHSPASRRSEN